MMDKLKLAVLFGGRSGEHEVSLMSARSVINALDPSKYEVVEIGITKDGHWFGGEAVLSSFERGDIQGLSRVTLLGEPERGSLYLRHEGRMETRNDGRPNKGVRQDLVSNEVLILMLLHL